MVYKDVTIPLGQSRSRTEFHFRPLPLDKSRGCPKNAPPSLLARPFRRSVSGKEMALRPSPPQRTVRASFPAYGSSLRSRSSERTGEHNGACLASVREVGLIAGIKRIRIPTDEHVSSDGDRTSAEDSHRSGRIWDTDDAGEHRARSLVGDEVLPQNPRR